MKSSIYISVSAIIISALSIGITVGKTIYKNQVKNEVCNQEKYPLVTKEVLDYCNNLR